MKAICALALMLCWLVPTVALSASADEDGTTVAHEHEDAGSQVHGGLDPDLAIVTALVFLILMAVLWKFAWGPIVAALQKREDSIADDLAAAKRNNEEAQRLLEDHKSKLAGTAEEVRQLLDGARRDAETTKQEIIADAQKAAESEKTRAVREITAAKDSALEDLAKKSVDTAVGLAGQIVKRQLKPDDHQELIGEALKQFPSKN